MQSVNQHAANLADHYLLKAVAEELKLPLVRIARMAELGYLTGDYEAAQAQLRGVERQANVAIHLLESYMLGLQLQQAHTQLEVEPVSVGSVLYDTAHQLQEVAHDYNVSLEVMIQGRQRLVMAHAKALRAAFMNVGTALIASQPGAPQQSQTVTLAAFPTSKGISAGVYGDQEPLTYRQWQRGRTLYGKARQPLLGITATHGAELVVADTIFRAMAAYLRPSSYHKQKGLAVGLPLSRQLQLV